MTHAQEPGGTVAGARGVREEDAFDVAAVDAWLRRHAQDEGVAEVLGDLPDGVPQVQQYVGGASNLTYLLRYAGTDAQPGRDLILRRPPAGQKAKSAHDMGREYRIQQALRPAFDHVPRMVARCEDTSVIGTDFYVMERVEGHVPRKELGVDLDAEQVRRLCLRVVDLLVELHRVDPGEVGLDDLNRGDNYVERQVAGWSKRFRAARTRNVPSYERVMRWLADNQPRDVGSVLIHNDFRLDNVVLDPDDPTRPIALLDWEMATIGDPLMDLGGALGYWVQADDNWLFRAFRRQPTHVPGMLTRREVVDHYLARTGRSVTPEQWTFYEVFGLFRLAVILQQIYYRYFHKQTTNPAFRHFWIASAVLWVRCERIIRAHERRTRAAAKAGPAR